MLLLIFKHLLGYRIFIYTPRPQSKGTGCNAQTRTDKYDQMLPEEEMVEIAHCGLWIANNEATKRSSILSNFVTLFLSPSTSWRSKFLTVSLLNTSATAQEDAMQPMGIAQDCLNAVGDWATNKERK